MLKRNILVAIGAAALLAAGCTTTSQTGRGSPESKRQSIDAEVDAAMSKLYAEVPSAREMVGKASGVLVFPSVISAGFVVGGSYGQGSLREGRRTSGYYSTAAGSVGLLAGADSKAVYILFMTGDALDRFKKSNGWTAGADASVTVVSKAADMGADTRTLRASVVGYTLSNGGLMADLSLDGTKIMKIDL